MTKRRNPQDRRRFAEIAAASSVEAAAAQADVKPDTVRRWAREAGISLSGKQVNMSHAAQASACQDAAEPQTGNGIDEDAITSAMIAGEDFAASAQNRWSKQDTKNFGEYSVHSQDSASHSALWRAILANGDDENESSPYMQELTRLLKVQPDKTDARGPDRDLEAARGLWGALVAAGDAHNRDSPYWRYLDGMVSVWAEHVCTEAETVYGVPPCPEDCDSSVWGSLVLSEAYERIAESRWAEIVSPA